jgi:hypothetical protein
MAKKNTTEAVPDFMKEVDSELEGFKEEIQVEKEPVPQPDELTITTKRRRGRKSNAERFAEKKEEKQVISDTIINGALLLLLIDVAIPSIITLINNKVSKKKIKSSRLQLTATQRSELQPLADEAARQIQMQGSPVTMLMLGLFGIYFTNFMMLKSD